MPKRKLDDVENDSLETGNVDQGDFSDGDDSDAGEDGDNGDKYNVMLEDDIEGQEDPTQEFDGEVQITPFNMKEEMEEGHFDKEGTYIFAKREKDEVKDHWLDNIDWVKVSTQTEPKNVPMEEDINVSEDTKNFDPIATCKEIVKLIKPGETVLKALKRMGGGKIQTASERWKKKKQAGQDSGPNETNKEDILKLTGLADSILSNTGNMDIYQETFEGIQHKIKQAEAGLTEKKTDSELDMFGEMFEEKAENEKEQGPSNGEPAVKKVRFNEEAKETSAVEKEEKQNAVLWQFKWENKDDAEIHGPHSTSEMQGWVNEGYFHTGVFVRRIGQQGDFYSSRRIDFELYL